MKCFRYSLLSDGPSDRMLMPALDWLLQRHSRHSFVGEWAELRRLPRPPRTLGERIQMCLELYPCELLFVHRDAESASRVDRVEEISQALALVDAPPAIHVVPVRMQEAWLLFNESAIREAADNPNGQERLVLPGLSFLEGVLDPKEVLRDLLRVASGHSGRRLKNFDAHARTYRLAQILTDYLPLLQVPAFKELDEDVRKTIKENGWA
ncbi:hypothetical protein [Archangium primigenium]|uniref:hypothetical protein n=1 Tax=[Archangium] primigenium TaxID=2792470 RepID=UPI00195B65E3|nr:hypothetical protein [Archangium primigenium]MBM7114066.1 hypothetical protein [Archangium primigenium]